MICNKDEESTKNLRGRISAPPPVGAWGSRPPRNVELVTFCDASSQTAQPTICQMYFTTPSKNDGRCSAKLNSIMTHWRLVKKIQRRWFAAYLLFLSRENSCLIIYRTTSRNVVLDFVHFFARTPVKHASRAINEVCGEPKAFVHRFR